MLVIHFHQSNLSSATLLTDSVWTNPGGYFWARLGDVHVTLFLWPCREVSKGCGGWVLPFQLAQLDLEEDTTVALRAAPLPPGLAGTFLSPLGMQAPPAQALRLIHIYLHLPTQFNLHHLTNHLRIWPPVQFTTEINRSVWSATNGLTA